jgi:hypothetical protein
MSRIVMETMPSREPSGMHDSERIRKWIPLAVPGAAVILCVLVGLGTAIVLVRP